MEDAQIIDHFFRRDPEAIRAAQEKYEKRCLAAARHILPDARDAEECVSDVWLRLWNAIPPERPRSLAAYITTVTRRLALDKCDYNRAAQRRSDLTVAFEELEGCLPAEDGAVRALEQQEFRRVLNGFLRKLTRQSRTYFIRRTGTARASARSPTAAARARRRSNPPSSAPVSVCVPCWKRRGCCERQQNEALDGRHR